MSYQLQHPTERVKNSPNSLRHLQNRPLKLDDRCVKLPDFRVILWLMASMALKKIIKFDYNLILLVFCFTVVQTGRLFDSGGQIAALLIQKSWTLPSGRNPLI